MKHSQATRADADESCRRFFSAELDGKKAYLGGDEANHLTNVLRLTIGEKIIVNANDGFDYFGTVDKIEKGRVAVVIGGKEQNPREPRIVVDVFQALSKGEKMELIAQKLNELGAHAITPMTTQFVTVKQNTTRLDRLEKITVQSSKQCCRANSLVIGGMADFSSAIAIEGYDLKILAYEHEQELTLAAALNGISAEKANNLPQKRIALYIGSEGGFDASEVQQAHKHGARVITLGRRILRVETASIALVSAVMCLVGEWQY